MENWRFRACLAALLLALIIGSKWVVHRFDVDFLTFVVQRSILEKLDTSVPISSIQNAFHWNSHRAEHSSSNRTASRQALLVVATYVEKRERLSQQDAEQIIRLISSDR